MYKEVLIQKGFTGEINKKFLKVNIEIAWSRYINTHHLISSQSINSVILHDTHDLIRVQLNEKIK